MSKKVKGIKLELGAFVGPTEQQMLPSAPDPNRERGGGGRGGGYGDRGGRGGGGFGSEGGWGRETLGRGGFEGGGGGYGGRGDGGYGGGGDDSRWGRGAASGPGGMRGGASGYGGGGGYGGRRDDGPGGGYGGGGGGAPMERPEHLRLKLDPVPTSRLQQAAETPAPASSAPQKDKWDNLFSGSRSGAGGPSRFGDGGRSGGGGFGDARGGSGFRRDGGDYGSGGFGGPSSRQGPGGWGNSRQDDVQDPRFNFGGGSGGFGRAGPYEQPQQQHQQQHQAPSVTSAAAAALSVEAAPPKPPSEADLKKKEKAAARLAAEQKAKEEKERKAAELQAIKEAAIAADMAAQKAVKDALSSGLKGDALAKHIAGMEKKPTGSALLTSILAQLEDKLNLKWCKADEYGAALKSLLENNVKNQVTALYAVQSHCHNIKFPKIDVKGTSRYFIEIVFQMLYQADIIEHAGFMSWLDDENDDVPGKTNAIVQTTSFISFLQEADDDGAGDEDEDEEDYGAPREFIQ